MGHASIRVSFNVTMKKQGHFDRYHEVTPIGNTRLLALPILILRKCRLWQRGADNKDPLFQ